MISGSAFGFLNTWIISFKSGFFRSTLINQGKMKCINVLRKNPDLNEIIQVFKNPINQGKMKFINVLQKNPD
jgi:hypothetical protein